MSGEVFSGSPGFGGFGGFGFGGFGFGDPQGLSFGGAGFGDSGHGGPELGSFGADGPGSGPFGHGHGAVLKRVVFGTTVILLAEGPASAEQILERAAAISGGGPTPPEHLVELAIGLLAGRGLVSVQDGVATLTELGRNLLAWRGVTSETAAVFLKHAAQFADGFKLHREFFEVAGLARSIGLTGTEDQKAKLTVARSKILDAVSDAKKELHLALAEN